MLHLAAGDVISAIELGAGILEKIIRALGDISRKIAIGVENKTGREWHALNVYFYSGTSSTIMPPKVASGV